MAHFIIHVPPIWKEMNFLFKYQAKATKKIEVIEEKRKQLVEHSEEVDKELTKAKPTVREQFGKYRKRDGSLNTRQVYDMLRSEEKKQEKVTDNSSLYSL